MNNTKTATKTFALIRFEAFGEGMTIVATGNETDMLNLHAETIETAPRGTFHSVRPADHDMTKEAAAAMADRLTPKMREALGDVAAYLRSHGARSVRPGMVRDWSGMYPTDIANAFKSKRVAGLVVTDGVPYGPKTYRLTAIGRVVGSEINAGR